MGLYRILKPLSRTKGKGFEFIRRGSLDTLDWLGVDKVAKLLEMGAISAVQGPPLSEIPGWKVRAKKLKKLGMEMAVDFLLSDSKEVASKVKVRPTTVGQWKAELKDWLTVKEDQSR